MLLEEFDVCGQLVVHAAPDSRNGLVAALVLSFIYQRWYKCQSIISHLATPITRTNQLFGSFHNILIHGWDITGVP